MAKDFFFLNGQSKRKRLKYIRQIAAGITIVLNFINSNQYGADLTLSWTTERLDIDTAYVLVLSQD